MGFGGVGWGLTSHGDVLLQGGDSKAHPDALGCVGERLEVVDPTWKDLSLQLTNASTFQLRNRRALHGQMR